MDIPVKKDTFANLLQSAVEAGYTYGIGYWGWADEDSSVAPKHVDLAELPEDPNGQVVWYAHWPLFKVVYTIIPKSA